MKQSVSMRQLLSKYENRVRALVKGILVIFFLVYREKNYQMEALDKRIMQASQELSMLRKQNAQLDQDYHEKEKLVISLKTKTAVLEQEVKDKGKLLEKQQELLRVANEQKQYFEEAVNDRDNHLQKKQAKVQTLSADLMKSNEIITKLQTDLAANKAKVRQCCFRIHKDIKVYRT